MTAMSLPAKDLAKRPSFDSPAGPVIFGGLAALVLLAALVIWAAYSPIAAGAVAPGKVTLEGHRRSVQHRDGGPIKAVLVREGEEVKQGQPLLELETSDLRTEVDILAGSRLMLTARLARLRAEAANAKALQWPHEFAASSALDPHGLSCARSSSGG